MPTQPSLPSMLVDSLHMQFRFGVRSVTSVVAGACTQTKHVVSCQEPDLRASREETQREEIPAEPTPCGSQRSSSSRGPASFRVFPNLQRGGSSGSTSTSSNSGNNSSKSKTRFYHYQSQGSSSSRGTSSSSSGSSSGSSSSSENSSSSGSSSSGSSWEHGSLGLPYYFLQGVPLDVLLSRRAEEAEETSSSRDAGKLAGLAEPDVASSRDGGLAGLFWRRNFVRCDAGGSAAGTAANRSAPPFLGAPEQHPEDASLESHGFSTSSTGSQSTSSRSPLKTSPGKGAMLRKRSSLKNPANLFQAGTDYPGSRVRAPPPRPRTIHTSPKQLTISIKRQHVVRENHGKFEDYYSVTEKNSQLGEGAFGVLLYWDIGLPLGYCRF